MKPTELAITLAALNGRYGGDEGWVYADEIRGRLKLLGFDLSAQQVAAYLRRMASTECPWVEVRERYDIKQYRVTRFGRTDIHNRFPGVQPVTPWMSALRSA